MDEAATVRSCTGGIAVTTTERGLPLRLHIDDDEMARTPDDLAAEILELCRLAALRAQVARRRELTASAVDAAVIRTLGLATEQDLAHAEETAATRDDGLPASWLRSV